MVKIIKKKLIINFSDYPNCNLQDYCSFYCNACKKNLCKEHYHHPVSCPFSPEEVEEVKPIVDFNYQSKKCQFCQTEVKNIQPFECPLCHGLFCSYHRLESDHKCPNNNRESSKSKYLRMKELAKQKREEAKKKQNE